MSLTNPNKYKRLSKILFYIGTFLLSFIFFNVLIGATLFIFKISINKYTSFIALAMSIMLIVLLTKKEDKKIVMRLIIATISTLLIFFSIIASGKFYDYSSDGNSYHKSTIGTLARGWNPVYEKLEDFDCNSTNPMNIKWNSYTWANHYAKASHIYAANITILTGNIETGKSINILSIIVLVAIVFSTLLYKNKDIFFSALFSLSVITCATISSQFLTNYIDILVYIYFFLLITLFFLIDKSNLFDSKKEYLIVYAMTLIIGINLKFSLFAYAGIFCLGYYLWYIYRLIKKDVTKKFFISFTIITFVSVLIAVLVVGLSVYPKNFFDKGNPFYPLMGKNKIDIMTMNQPDYFKDKSAIEKFVISTFSKSGNLMGKYEAEYKIPFSVVGPEVDSLYAFDLRIAGNGVFFSGILIVSLCYFLINIIKTYKKDKTLFYLMVIPIVILLIMIFLMSDAWWARYFPQLHLIVFFALLLMKISENSISNKVLYMLLAIILINNFIVFSSSFQYAYDYAKIVNTNYKNFEETTDSKTCNLELYAKTYDGALYNVSEKYNNYSIKYVGESEYNKNQNEFQNMMGGSVQWRCTEK